MTSRPRVLHVVSSLSTYGAERFVAALVDRLRGDVEVAVMTMYSPRPEVARAFGGILIDIARKGRADVGFFWRMVAGMRRFRPQIVHTHVHNGKYWGRLAAVVAGVPAIVHTEHNSDFRASFPVRLANRLLHRRTARIIAFSAGHAARIAAAEAVPAGRFAVLPNGVIADPLQAEAGAVPERFGAGGRAVVLHVGRLMPVKNQALAIQAFGGCRALRERALLVIVGAGPDEPVLREAVSRAGIDGDVVFAGYRDDVPRLLAGADAVVMTSRNEAMPLVALEAMLARVAIVTVPWTGSDELFEGGRLGAIAASYEPAALAATLLSVLSPGVETAARTAAAYEVACERYTLDATAARHATLYRALVDEVASLR